jgi:hypothetical protein
MVVVLAGGKLLAFAPQGGRLGASLVEAPAPPGDLVLAQWALGPYVARWTAQLASYMVATVPDRRGR